MSLPKRFVAALVAAVLVTSLAITWTSVKATSSFLHEKIEQKFAATLSATRERIELWHTERELELGTLASSSTLVDALGELRVRGSKTRSGGFGHRYLTLVLEQLPQYRALFLLDREGNVLAWVGEAHSIEPGLRAELASIAHPTVSEPHRSESGRLHVASAPIANERGEQVGSVHGTLRSRDFDDLLRSSLGPQSEIFIVGSDHTVLAPDSASANRPRYERPLPKSGSGATVEQYAIAGGSYVVGGTVPFARFGWTLVIEEPYASAFAPVVAILNQTLAINLGVILLLSTLAYFTARKIVRPVHALSQAAREIADGNLGVEIPVSTGGGEIGQLTQALGEMMSRLGRNQLELEEKNAELEEANEALEKLSITDGLTGLYNHRYFQEEFEREMKRASRSNDPLSLILIDIDDFKLLNDSYGHAAGDVALATVARTMKKMTRGSDLLARYGGEEFALLSFGNSLVGASGAAEKIRQAVAEIDVRIKDQSDSLTVTVSIGVAEFDGDPKSFKSFFNDADRALYRAKAAGKNCVMTTSDPD